LAAHIRPREEPSQRRERVPTRKGRRILLRRYAIDRKQSAQSIKTSGSQFSTQRLVSTTMPGATGSRVSLGLLADRARRVFCFRRYVAQSRTVSILLGNADNRYACSRPTDIDISASGLHWPCVIKGFQIGAEAIHREDLDNSVEKVWNSLGRKECRWTFDSKIRRHTVFLCRDLHSAKDGFHDLDSPTG
jgi:hypothetical protein